MLQSYMMIDESPEAHCNAVILNVVSHKEIGWVQRTWNPYFIGIGENAVGIGSFGMFR